jgi:L-lactate utilization protein LutB
MQLQEKEMDLSYVALNFAQRKELLQTIGVKLKALMQRDDVSSNLMKELKSMEYSLNNTEEEQEKWDNFQVHFNTEYNDFITKLQQLDPKIKESMLLMCTYLRMGKNNKEIASLLNISLSALDKRKLRLKEKFNVPEEITLNEFLRGL